METQEKYSILVVDDDPLIRSLLVKVLSLHGYEVSEASETDKALQMLEQNTFDLLLTDYKMPGKNGLELLIETSAHYPDMVRILITGMGEKNLYREAINRASVFSVIEKPVSNQHLLETVDRGIEFRAHRMREQEEIRRLQELYHTIFDLTSDLIQCIDISGNFIYVNPAFHKVLGYGDEDIKTLTFFEMIPDDHQKTIRGHIVRVQKGEIIEPFNTVMVSKSGNPVYLEGTVTMPGQREGIVAVSFIFRDVTERRRAEEEIQTRLTQEIMIARIAHLLVIAEEPAFVNAQILEIVGESAGVNRAYIYSFDEKKKKFSKVETWYTPERGKSTQWEDEVPFSEIPWIAKKLTTESIISFSNRDELPEPDCQFMKKHHITANLIFPIRIGITIVGILGFDVVGKSREWDPHEIAIQKASVDIIANAWTRQQEIDYRKEKEREAEQSRLLVIRADRLAALGTMAAGIIHEITQPLNAITVSTQTILNGLSHGWELDDTKVKNSLGLIVGQIKRMNDIMTTMRAFAHEGFPAARERANLNTLVQHVHTMLGEQMKAHGIEFELNLCAIPDIEMNTQQILQVILNLVTNARQALDDIEREGKKITLSTHPSDNSTIVLKVIDNGPGIPADLHEKIFDPFFTTKDVGKGTGLGLSISSGIIHDHNGVLDVQSSLNEGATFIVNLPVV